MKKISVVAIALTFLFGVTSVGPAEAKGWCDNHPEKAFCVKKESIKAKIKANREARKDKREARKAARGDSPGVFTKERNKFGGQQNVVVNVQQNSGRNGGDRGRGGGGGGWDRGRGGGGWGRGPGWYGPHYGPDPSVAIVGGIIGGFIGNVFAPRPNVVVVEEQARQPEGVVITPWTADWYSYCGNKFETFDAKTGYYTTHDSRKVFCQ